MPRKLLHKGVCWKALALSWRRCRPCLAHFTGAAMIEGEYTLFPGAAAAPPASSLREPPPEIRASLLTQAKFFSTRALLPIAPPTLSCSTLSNFGEVHFIRLAIATPRLEADAYAEFIDAAAIATLSALLQSSLSARHSFFGKQNLPTAKPSAAFSPLLGEVHRSGLRSEFVRGASGRFAQAVYGKCSLVLPSRCYLSIVYLTLVRTIAVVALIRPPCHRLRRSPKSLRSTAHANVACVRWLQGRRGALGAARQSLVASQLRMLGKWGRDAHGDHAIALLKVIFAYRSRRFVCLCFC
jgi:hypothetical protein